MIEYINTQLNQWAIWLRSGRTRLGYPSQSAFVSVMGGAAGPQVSLPDDEALSMSKAVNALEPRLKETVVCFYVHMSSCTANELARHLNVSRDTVYERINRAHVQIMGYLNDDAAGIPVEPWREK